MSNLSKRKKQDKYAKQKLAAIPVLLIVLGYVLFSGGSDDPKSRPASTTKPVTTTETSNLVASAAPIWEEVDLEFLEGPNPLASYRHVEQPAKKLVAMQETNSVDHPSSSDQLQQRLQSLPPVRYHFQSNTQNVVMLGEELLSAGDSIDADLKLSDIQDGQLIFHVETNPKSSFQ